MFNESVQNHCRKFFDDWYTERRVVTDQTFQVDNGSAQSVNSPKYLICAHQQANRSDPPNKRTKISFFDKLDVRKNLPRWMACVTLAIAFLQTMD